MPQSGEFKVVTHRQIHKGLKSAPISSIIRRTLRNTLERIDYGCSHKVSYPWVNMLNPMVKTS